MIIPSAYIEQYLPLFAIILVGNFIAFGLLSSGQKKFNMVILTMVLSAFASLWYIIGFDPAFSSPHLAYIAIVGASFFLHIMLNQGVTGRMSAEINLMKTIFFSFIVTLLWYYNFYG